MYNHPFYYYSYLFSDFAARAHGGKVEFHEAHVILVMVLQDPTMHHLVMWQELDVNFRVKDNAADGFDTTCI